MSSSWRLSPLALSLVLLISVQASSSTTSFAAAGDTDRISVDSAGSEALGGDSSAPRMSANNRFVMFYSGATNLVPNDTNGVQDVFVHDRQTGEMERISVDSAGNESTAGFDMGPGDLSADGRYATFYSEAGDLVANDLNGEHDAFLHDRQTGMTERISVDSAGSEATGGDSFPCRKSVSADGRYVVFRSGADNLVPDDTNDHLDAFVKDRQTGAVERVSIKTSGAQMTGGHAGCPEMTPDGRFVIFTSDSPTLVSGDTNDLADAFLHDRQTDTTERVSLDDGDEFDRVTISAAVTPDGRYVVFLNQSSASNIYVYDRDTEVTELASASGIGTPLVTGLAGSPSISDNGRFVTFEYTGNDLGTQPVGQYAVFLRDLRTDETVTISLDTNGQDANDDARGPYLSANGRFVAFYSIAPDIIPGDGNELSDVFIHDRGGTGAELTQGNVNCIGDADGLDAIALLFSEAASTAGVCPAIGDPQGGFPWGDLDCSGDATVDDALFLIAHMTGVPREPVDGDCVPIGAELISA